MVVYNYNFDKNVYEQGKARDTGRYLYDPTTDSYVESIPGYLCSTSRGKKDFFAFDSLIREMVSKYFDERNIYALCGGDYRQDWVFEVRMGEKSMKYSPYAMYVLSESLEDTLERFNKCCLGML